MKMSKMVGLHFSCNDYFMVIVLFVSCVVSMSCHYSHCNTVLADVPQSTLEPLQRIQNAAARLVHQLNVHYHFTPSLMLLHWLPIRCRIDYWLQTMYDYVRNTHWQMPSVSERHHPYVQQCSNMYWPVIGFQQHVRDAMAANQVQRMRLLTCRTGCMELTATWHLCCRYVQETTENALF